MPTQHPLHTKLASVLTTVTLLLAIVGFPLPQSGPIGDADFPCRDHGCGCTTALMCRTACCCAKPTVPKPKTDGGCCSTERDTPKIKSGWVIGATECQGLAATWSGVGLLVPPSHEELLNGPEIVVYARPSDRMVPSANDLCIESPPPRLHYC